MHDPLPVRLVQRVGDLDAEAERLRERQRALAEPVRERLALEQLHDEVLRAVLVADVVERADVRMRELRDRLRLPLEPLANLGGGRQMLRQHLDRDGALEPRVPRLVDLSHPPGAERRQDLVGTEFCSGGEAQEWAEVYFIGFFSPSCQFWTTTRGGVTSLEERTNATNLPSGVTA